jgi:hypothetical protein
MSSFGPVELGIEKRTGSTSIASQTYTPDINIGNVASNNFASPQQQSFEFDITEEGDYVIAIYSAPTGWSDCIVGQLILTANSYVSTDIHSTRNKIQDNKIYDLQGHKINHTTKAGIYIQNGQKILIK